ncbi:terpene synthase, partial [Lactarius deliciosus]
LCGTPLNIPVSPKQPFTDYTRWRLRDTDDGRHIWDFLRTEDELATRPSSNTDKYWLGLPLAKSPLDAARNGYTFYKKLQTNGGHWVGEYGGPMFLLPGLVIGSYEERLEMIRYLFNHTHPDDGGWGLHIEGHSTVLGTALNYVALRLLGVPAEHPVIVRARAVLHKLGGASASASWGKFWLSVLNVYEWEGNNPIPPELWLLPKWLPFHPSRWWIHTRTVYVPMSYLYGVRFKAAEDPLILALREELYTQPYDTIDWPAQRNNVSAADLHSPHSGIFDFISCIIPPLRHCWNRRRDENTGYQTLGPVSKMMNLIARYHRRDFMWLASEGMMMCGTNGSQLQGLASDENNKESLIKALEWLDRCQIRENPKYFEVSNRHRTKGAWPFSTKEQGYTVSDCTGEGLNFTPTLVSDDRLFDAVDTLLTMQNRDGGFASYELLFGNIMIEYEYPECTTSVITSLSIFRKHYPNYRTKEISETIQHAIAFLHAIQQPEGGWVGSWGICFTYATMFALESLSLVGETYETSESARRACDFLVSKQRADGGWGESYKTCEACVWIEHENTQVVQTSWAAMALMYAKYPHTEPISKAVALVMSRQLPVRRF